MLLWIVTYLELRIERGTRRATIGRLLLTVILFAGAAGVLDLFGPRAWPTPIVLIAGLALPLALRSSEARGTMGLEGFGQGLLHVLAVAQIGAALVLLDIPLTVMAPALIALAFYAWSGAAEALRGPASGRSIAVEFGSLALFGLVVGLLLHRP